MKNLNVLCLGLLTLFSVRAVSHERIRAMHFDKSKVETVYVSPGLATLMIFPCDINEAIVGQEQGIKAVVSPTSKKQVTLYCSSSFSVTTNLIVRCGNKTDPFVFDLIVNKNYHQDVLKVTDSFNGPSDSSIEDKNLVDSSDIQTAKRKKKVVIEVSPPVLFEESK